ncbi:MAG: type II CRISPR RNA-guided endonuclease Cas9, partial [Planctomycetaceae bacterium]|nr:type II CRISPR RNA-guided endonuclease Cas9 [Planctomycetaceae bacterium]
MIPVEGEHSPAMRLGVRCFDSGTGTESEIEQGKDESRNLKRRAARSVRRNQWRRKRRTLKLFNLLRNHGLLPMGQGIQDTPIDRQELINELDKELAGKLSLHDDRVSAHLLPYKLRAMALDEQLEPFALGRIFLHLSQRRGFLSNKKAPSKEGEDEKGLKKDISDLSKEIKEKGFRTLGEYFASLDPEEKRIRQRWTGRDMFRDELKAICDSQDKYYHDLLNKKVVVDSWKDNPNAWKNNISKMKRKKLLSNEHVHTQEMTLREALEHALFFQRPLKSQKHLIGKCQLERGKRRAQLASLEAQQFRYWQKILDLQYRNMGGFMVPLSPEQQNLLAEELENNAKLTYAQMRTILGFKQPRQSKEEKEEYKMAGIKYKPPLAFNFEVDEDDSDKGLKGNTTSSRIAAIIPDRWNVMPDKEKELLVSEILQFEHEDALARRLEKVFQFDSNTASQLAAVQLERDYASLSQQAIRKILPLMIEKRIPFATARKEIYGEQFDEDHKEPLDFLPPLLKSKEDPRNPVVTRALTELRKVVNALIRKYGKPETIRVELARDMKKGRQVREEITKVQNENEKERKLAHDFLKESRFETSETNILKYRLWIECNRICPYSGRPISARQLFGESPVFQIEHIRPFSKTLDDSYANKTLCYYEHNQIKGNRIPSQAFTDPQTWHEIITRVKQFQGKFDEEKLERFQEKTIPDDQMPARLLVDTGHISKSATEYLGLLFGKEQKSKIQVLSGGVTSWLRQLWGLNGKGIYGKNVIPELPENTEKPWKKRPRKSRTDHRHHAVDAFVIALCEPRYVQLLAMAAEKASNEVYAEAPPDDSLETLGQKIYERGLNDKFVKYYFQDRPFDWRQVRTIVENINVSFRANRKVSGGFHKETNYSKPQIVMEDERRHIRKLLGSMTLEEIDRIVDDAVR